MNFELNLLPILSAIALYKVPIIDFVRTKFRLIAIDQGDCFEIKNPGKFTVYIHTLTYEAFSIHFERRKNLEALEKLVTKNKIRLASGEKYRLYYNPRRVKFLLTYGDRRGFVEKQLSTESLMQSAS